MIAYHATTEDRASSILQHGFLESFFGANGTHFGSGVYLATTKRRAREYGKVILTVEFEGLNLFPLSNWYNTYMRRCKELHARGVPKEEVNTVVGEEYKKRVIASGFRGIIIDSVIGNAQEIVLYDLGVIQRVFREGK